MPHASPLADRDLFTFWTREVARYGDTDRQGHVNNAVFATFCESGRIAFLFSGGEPTVPHNHGFVIARLELDFRAELHWRDAVDIGTRVLAIGRRSFRLGQGLFRDESCVATAESVLVLMDERTRLAAELPAALQAYLGAT